MAETLLAHSARQGYPAQSYKDHVSEVVRRATESALGIAPYTPSGDLFVSTVRSAAEYHDLGKVDEANQRVLHGKTQERLPIDHWDAGAALLIREKSVGAAICVLSHHTGLPSIPEENSKKHPFRVRSAIVNGKKTVQEITDGALTHYVDRHAREIGTGPEPPHGTASGPCFLRFAISCIVDADHSDTACHYGTDVLSSPPSLRPADRLELLDAHVKLLAKGRTDDRTELRSAVYQACRVASTEPRICTCDSPVGTGKTTAVMAHLLRVAHEKHLRHVFVILPFTNIIDQSVEVYRRALVGIGERPEDIVAAHHHKAEFEDIESRQFAFLWEAPIVVTTAVQFFETLASNHPVALRKLHQLPGSVVFIDEAHAALPSRLWPQAWRWLRELESRWGCNLVLGSGSLNRFWELPEFSDPPMSKDDIPELVGEAIRTKAMDYERDRVEYKTRSDSLGLGDLIAWQLSLPGPRLLIVNTVQSAAVIAAEMAKRLGREHVEHLSTSLCQRDRKVTLDRIKTRLEDHTDSDWTLVATSCVEAGMDLSFRTAARERCSLNSLVQVGGRVNRNGEYGEHAPVWDFQLSYEGLLKAHPAFETSSAVLGELFLEKRVGPKFCTTAMQREVRTKNTGTARDDAIVKAEGVGKFPDVANQFKVIDSNTVTAIVDQELRERLERHDSVDRNLIQQLSVQIWFHRKDECGVIEIANHPGLYFWPLKYDNFLGYMAGVLKLDRFMNDPEARII